jgi:acetylornithine deacetylase/succinyl-diaminopimelate desuccinylase-like protein
MAHVAALRAFGDELPVGIVLFIEGEEEFGSESLEDLLLQYRSELAADVIVIADSGNWDIGHPALTTSLRGIVNCFVEVRTLDHAVHSGGYGGAVPDALTTLCRVLATLHDDAGDVAIEGLVRREASPLDYPEDRFREEAGMLDGVQLIGTGRIVERVWTKPAVTVLGIDAPPTAEAPNALTPTAKAKVSIRIAPGDDPKKAFLAMQAHLDRHAPWGARVTLTLEHDGSPVCHRGHRTGLRRRPRRLRRRLGRRGPGRHRRRRVDPVHRDVPGPVPGRGDPGHRRGGPGRPGARARTRVCIWASSSGFAWPRRCCCTRWRSG